MIGVRLATARRQRRLPAGTKSASPAPTPATVSLAAHQNRSGVARLDRRTKNLTKRLQPGDIAILDHVDIDRVSAEALVRCQVAAVVNVAASISGRYPNAGPEILLNAGVPLLDRVESDVFDRVREGELVTLAGDCLMRDGAPVAEGVRQTPATLEAATAEARAGLAEQLEAFAQNTMDFLRRERDLLLDGVGVPQLRTTLNDRHVLLVVRGYEYRQDLASLRPYIREYRPVLIGVDGGADALHEEGYRPDLIIGDMDSVSDEMLRSGAELVVHAYPDGSAPGLARLEDLGLQACVFPAPGTSEDVAMLLADELGASLIVAVGTHGTLVEFLDKGRAGMASTFLTRLRVGGKLVDAKGVSRLYRSRIHTWSLSLLVLAALVTLVVALSLSTVGQAYLTVLADKWHSFTFWLSRVT
jgi:uncharacterized membrane-anchored protein